MPRSGSTPQVQPTDPTTSEPAVVASGAPATPAAAPAETPFDFDSTWNGLDERTRTGIANHLYEDAYRRYSQSIEEEYPDIVSLAREAQSNPQLRNVLKEFSSDKELREFIADGGTFEQLRAFQKDPELRKFAWQEATDIYRRHPQNPQQPQDPMAPLQSKIQALEQRFETEQNVRDQGSYIETRRSEVQALMNAVPTLQSNRDLLGHVVQQAENNFMIAAANRGIDTSPNNPHWPAMAVRQGIRPPAFLDVYRQYERLTGNTPPPAAPQGAPAVRRSTPQAPRTKVEAQQKLSREERKARFLSSVKKG